MIDEVHLQITFASRLRRRRPEDGTPDFAGIRHLALPVVCLVINYWFVIEVVSLRHTRSENALIFDF